MAPKAKDLTGKKFNMLTVLRELPGHRVICQCECGNIKEFDKYQVSGGHTKSCGCLKNNITDYTGKKFNHLTIIKELGKSKVLCKCDCGNEIIKNKQGVLNGRIKSCGCVTRFGGKRDLTGMRIGRLTVVKPLDKDYRKWLCHCDCGNDVEISRGHIVAGDTLSCGCLRADDLKEKQQKTVYSGTTISAIKNNKPNKNNTTSGVKGVCFVSSRQEYKAYITIQKRNINLGYYKNKENAIKARKKAEEQYLNPIIKKFETSDAKQKKRHTTDIIGKKYNMLTVVKDLGAGKILCRCECGNIKEFSKSNVVSGHTKSCGCLKKGRKKKEQE